MNNAILADALHNASSEIVLTKRTNNRRQTKAELEDMRMRINYGKGVVVGCVAGLMANGMYFDDAWQLCLESKPTINPSCIPEGWPSLADYLARKEAP